MTVASHVCPECGASYARGGFCPIDGTPLAEARDPLLGTEIGRYRLARVVGEGGMGRVYLGVQPAIGSRVAIKLLSDQCARSPDLLERFFAEARAVNLIRHENIVSVLDLAQLADGRPYIVMEYVEGQTLAAVVAAGDAPLGGVVQVMTEVLSALAAAHAIGIVHRDLKPDNVLVTVEGHAKVLDFGIAKLAPGLSQQLSPRTRTGALLGTPAYMAPEQISGSGSIDARTDIYAAGIVLFQAVTGRVPFVGEALYDLMRLHLEEPPPSPRLARGDLPPALEHVILTALAKDPAARFQSATAMAQALQHAASTLPPGQWQPLSRRGLAGRVSAAKLAPTPPRIATQPAPTPAPARRTHRASVVVIAALALTAALAVGITLVVVGDRAAAGGAATPDAAAPVTAVGAAGGTQPPGGDAAAATIASPVVGASDPRAVEPPPSRAKATGAGSPPPSRAVATGAGSPPPSRAVATGAGSPPPSRGTVVVGPNVSGRSAPPPSSVASPPASAAPEQLTVRAEYDPARFDPVAYLPVARRLARRLIADAQLTSFEFDPVYPDGRVDLAQPGRDREYRFRSPARSARPAGVPRNVAVERACMVYVELGPRSVTARVVTSDDCDAKLVRDPRCAFAAVWQQAIARGTPTDVVARIGWLFDEQWFFDVDLEGHGGGVSTLRDSCR